MPMLMLGLLLLALKAGGWVQLGWPWVLSPFGLALLWWWWADWSGYTQRQAMRKDQARREARLAKARAQLRADSDVGSRGK
ncbi:small Trp-rich protein [Tepidimonas alkaliphilus]|uniref:Small Trp-rich protein n=1 Tax=Tepidimonas alkaliphilus TaxID=2588942 RepID=A0A554W603_9BURK|nr:TIGR04438 family Trp-rich protein [Tepidimonas alkaliphilus]TSE18990.1 small Trp-rich protein [Tepidimonas alkaliphilus]